VLFSKIFYLQVFSWDLPQAKNLLEIMQSNWSKKKQNKTGRILKLYDREAQDFQNV
jgi:hypothetical protein